MPESLPCCNRIRTWKTYHHPSRQFLRLYGKASLDVNVIRQADWEFLALPHSEWFSPRLTLWKRPSKFKVLVGQLCFDNALRRMELEVYGGVPSLPQRPRLWDIIPGLLLYAHPPSSLSVINILTENVVVQLSLRNHSRTSETPNNRVASPSRFHRLHCVRCFGFNL